MKRSITALSIAATLALAGCASATPEAAPETTVAPAPSQATGVQLEDFTGKNLKEARTALKDQGVKVNVESEDPAQTILSEKNWTVTKQVPAAGETATEVLLTAMKPEAEKVTEEATSSGLTETYAISACTQYAENEFPFGVKMHWVLGVLAHEIQDDQWFLKVEATVTNALGAKEKGVNVECFVGGTNDAQEVIAFNAY